MMLRSGNNEQVFHYPVFLHLAEVFDYKRGSTEAPERRRLKRQDHGQQRWEPEQELMVLKNARGVPFAWETMSNASTC